MAKFIVETVGFDLRQGESFGFGSGRGVYYTVRQIPELVKSRHPLRVNDISLVSLCGDCQVTSGAGSGPILDADYNASGSPEPCCFRRRSAGGGSCASPTRAGRSSGVGC
jgi:hypothetical protein